MTPPHAIPRPADDEYLHDYAKYVAQVAGDDALAALAEPSARSFAVLAPLSDAAALHRYAPEKWSVKQVVGHLADAERVFTYRAMRIARGDATPLAGFDENAYVAAGAFDTRPFAALLDEWRAVRAGTLALFGGLEPVTYLRRGTANGAGVTVRALAWIVAGHELHHLGILRERYGVGA